MKQDQSVEVSEVIVSPDERPIYDALRAADVPESLAYPATQRVRDLAGVNTVTRLRAEIQIQVAKLNARIDGLGSELRAEIKALNARIDGLGSELRAGIRSLRWMMGLLTALLAVLVVLIAQALQEQDLPWPPSADTAPPSPVEAPSSSAVGPVGTSVPDEVPATAP